jgi:hypothetical protein
VRSVIMRMTAVIRASLAGLFHPDTTARWRWSPELPGVPWPPGCPSWFAWGSDVGVWPAVDPASDHGGAAMAARTRANDSGMAAAVGRDLPGRRRAAAAAVGGLVVARLRRHALSVFDSWHLQRAPDPAPSSRNLCPARKLR